MYLGSRTLLCLALAALAALPDGLCFHAPAMLPAASKLRPAAASATGLRGLRAGASGPEVDRRAVLVGLLGSLSLSQAAGAEVIGPPPSATSLAQGDIQALVSPGHWIGQIIGVNSHSEKWALSGATPEQASTALKEALEGITPQERKKLLFEHLDIKEASPQRVRALTWTKSEWLDVLDVSFRATPDGKGTEATISLYATGFLPTSIPLAPIINTALFFFPFVSPNPVAGGLLQVTRSQDLYKMVSSRLPKKA